MNPVKIFSMAFSALFCLAASQVSLAAPVPFSITSGTWSNIGSGYGTGSDSTLDVTFVDTFSSTSFALNSVGNRWVFDIGFLRLNNEDSIGADETDNLDASWSFTFSDPLVSVQTLTATGVAFVGPTDDDAVDFTINWAPVFVDFGNGGRFKVEISGPLLRISTALTVVGAATFTLLALPSTTAVPEPGALALIALGAVMLRSCRRKRVA